MSHLADNQPQKSTVSPLLWRVILISLCIILVIGILTALVLANGAANPTREQLISLDQTPQGNVTAPFTLELTNGRAFTLTCDIQTLNFRIRDDSYFSVDSGQPDWHYFHHILRGDNALYLHVDELGNFVFRVNHEIADQGQVESTACQYAVIES